MIMRSDPVEGVLYSYKNLGAVQDHMQELHEIVKMMFHLHEKYNSMLQSEAQKTDE